MYTEEWWQSEGENGRHNGFSRGSDQCHEQGPARMQSIDWNFWWQESGSKLALVRV